MTDEQAEKLVEGIWWKNTVENYAHMGLDQSDPLQHIERMVRNITRVLTDTGAIPRDPTGGKPNLIYYREILQGTKRRSFNPGPENVREDELPALSDSEWKKLMKVGTDPDPLEFARGTTTLTRASRFKLNEIAERLGTTRLYIMIRGHASTRGDQELNEAQALDRAEKAKGYLVEKGIGGNRIRAIGVEASGTPFVEFILGQPPY